MSSPLESDGWSESTESGHETLVANLIKPAWLQSGLLLDHTWHIAQDDPAKKRNAVKRVYFDVVIAPGSVRTTHPEHSHDLTTAKLLVYNAQRPAFSGGVTSSSAYTPIIAREYFAYVRWRNSRGIPNNACLTPSLLDEFFSTIRQTGPLSLLPQEQRIVALLKRYREEQIDLPLMNRFSPRKQLALTPIVNEIGLETPLSLSKTARSLLMKFAAERGFEFEAKVSVPQPGKRMGRRAGHDEGDWTASRVHPLLRPIELLYRYRRHLPHDRIQFDPFPAPRTTWRVAEALSSAELRRTPSVPAAQACHLVDSALRWVLGYSDDIRRLHAALAAGAKHDPTPDYRYRNFERVIQRFVPSWSDTGLASPWPVSTSYSRRDGRDDRPTVRSLLFDLLPAACMIVLAAFSARRHDELESLQAGCISSDNGDFWLKTWVSKTLRRVADIPVPASVARAVEVLEWLSETRRAEAKMDWLFDFSDPVPGLHRPFDMKGALEKFVKIADVPALPDGSQWWFTPHQFRRFFGIVYYHHYRFPHLAALSNFYRHFDPDMTRRYVNEAADGGFIRRAEEQRMLMTAAEKHADRNNRERLKDFNDEACRFRIERYLAILDGSERVGGHGGEQLRRELQELCKKVRSQIEISRKAEESVLLNKALQEFARGQRLEPNPLGHSYCRCKSDPLDLRAAACVTRDKEFSPSETPASTPNPAFASDLVCSSCPHNVQLPENEAYWTSMHAHEVEQASCAISPILQRVALGRAAAAAAHLTRCFDA